MSRAWCGALCAAIVICVAAAPARADDNGLCTTSVVHNYLKPLEGLAALRTEPAKRLPFAPRNLSLGIIGASPLIVANEEVGYFLDYWPTGPRPTGKYLRWLVTAKLDRIDSSGRVLESVGLEQVRGLRFRSSHTLAFALSGKPALYRLEVVFRNGSGERLGRYGRYLRVLESRSAERLTLPQSAYRPGETVTPRLENEGTDRLLYGLRYEIDEFDGGGWVPTSLGPKVVIPIGLSSIPGEAASCWGFTVPAETPPGRYRFRTSADIFKTSARREGPKRVLLTAEFEVVP